MPTTEPFRVVGPYILFIVGLALTVVNTINLFTGKSDRIPLPDDEVMVLHILELTGEQVAKAITLADEGQHLDAARILINVAGAKRALLPSRSGSAKMLEQAARQQLFFAGQDKAQAYREFLRSVYPEWSDAKPPSSNLSQAGGVGLQWADAPPECSPCQQSVAAARNHVQLPVVTPTWDKRVTVALPTEVHE